MFARVAGLAAFTAAAMLALASPASAGVQITELSKVAIEGGNLIIEGKTRRANKTVILDDGVDTALSDGNKNFRFELVYLPTDCVVDLKVGNVVKTAVVANCGPKGVNPLGAWRGGINYLTDDVVTFLGSSWRAKSDNKRKRPDANPSIWEQFAAKGDVGATGPQGLKGDTGPKGDAGNTGAAGPAGATGPQGIQGAQGPVGPAGNDGAQGSPGADGASCTLSPAQCPLTGVATMTCGAISLDVSCFAPKRVFVTSTTYNGAAGASGEAVCNARASAAGLPGTYTAWLSVFNNQATSPSQRFNRSEKGYLLVDGTVVAASWADLVDGTIANPIDMDEFGATVAGSFVWTGTLATGTAITTQDLTCNQWNNDTNASSGLRGRTDVTDGGWTNTSAATCDGSYRFYCFQQ